MGFVLFLIVAFISITFLIGSPQEEPVDNSKRCNLHKWITKNPGEDNEYLVCETCGLLGGSGFYEEKDHYQSDF